MLRVTCAELPSLIGHEIGPSGWTTITQEMVNQYANGVKDLEWIHVDVERANRVLGETIVHGLLTLSLVPSMSKGMLHIVDRGMDLNYGYYNIRFLSVVHGGDRVRLRGRVLEVLPRGEGLLLSSECIVEVEGSKQPAVVANWKLLLFPGKDTIPRRDRRRPNNRTFIRDFEDRIVFASDRPLSGSMAVANKNGRVDHEHLL
jgi:acyl dehydratase